MIGTVALIPSIPGKNFSHVGLMAGNESLEAVKEMYLKLRAKRVLRKPRNMGIQEVRLRARTIEPEVHDLAFRALRGLPRERICRRGSFQKGAFVYVDVDA
jgi:hypothetical protein